MRYGARPAKSSLLRPEDHLAPEQIILLGFRTWTTLLPFKRPAIRLEIRI